MALTATASQGFEFQRYVSERETLLVPGDPGDTFNAGDIVTFTLGEGIADPCAADEPAYGIVQSKTVCPSATSAGFPVFNGSSNPRGRPRTDVEKTLVEIIPLIAVGTPISKCTFANHQDDENITAYTAGTPSIEVATAATDDANGALLYVYGGPSAGSWNVVASVTTNVMTLHRKFETAPTTASDVIWLAGEAADNRGIGFFGRITNVDANTLNCAQGADDGDWMVYGPDAHHVADLLKNLMLPVVPAGAFLFA